jgi:hypothetical protein
MRLKVMAGVVTAAVLTTVAPVLTITNGQPDGNRHPYVGLAIQFIPDSDFISVCSGSALSETRFLTAAHCFDPNLPVFVTYKNSPPYSLAADFTQGTFYPSDTYDVAVIVLDEASDPGEFAVLPTAGLVDELPMMTDVDVIGYGVQGFLRGGGRPDQVFLLTRYFAPSQLVQSNDVISSLFLKLTANPSKGTGGICFGDSGGPDILSGTNVILGVNSFVTNSNCSGVTYSQRIDLPEVLAFIDSAGQ